MLQYVFKPKLFMGMKKFFKITGILILLAGLVLGYGYYSYKSKLGHWNIKLTSATKDISWIKFEWGNDSLGGKYVERTAMLIPVKIEGIPKAVNFQFDLGSYMTMMYEKNLLSVYKANPQLKNNIKNPVEFWNRLAVINAKLTMGNYTVSNTNFFVWKNYGDVLSAEEIDSSTSVHIGTIGADLFQQKILIIDYPNQQFAILDTLPSSVKTDFIDVKMEANGMAVLPMKIKGKTLEIGFDNGSSIFPIITPAKNEAKFSSNPIIDTITISSWSKLHNVTGRMITDSFELAGKKFCNVKVYSNYSGLGISKKTDGMTGNALFWNSTIIIDFKNKKFGFRK